jgi:hypothetical protein
MINNPLARTKLLDVLRPPDGMSLDEGVGTTYSLDLTALLVAPLAFTLFDAEDDDGRVRLQSLEVLESLRRYARKLTVFCQAGQICAPRGQFPQFTYLERSVIQCAVPGGSFHPKLWILRFKNDEGEVVYRVVCLTRNLTFDRSWDTVLVLEGPLVERKNAVARNHPLADFVRALQNLASEGALDDMASARIARIADDLRRVDFKIPNGFDELRFWPLGIDGHRRSPFPDDGRRLLVISPFLTAGFLRDLFDRRSRGVLISTVPALEDIGPWPEGIEQVFTLADAASPEPEEEHASENPLESSLTGLHAKCYVVDDGHAARVLTGSANATASGFNGNVEFLVELSGTRQSAGIDSLLASEQGATRLVDILQPVKQPLIKVRDEEQEDVERRLDDACAALSSASLELVCSVSADRPDAYDVSLRRIGSIEVPAGVAATCWPVTLAPARSRAFDSSSETAARFENLSALALSRFVSFRLEAGAGEHRQSREFALKLPLIAGPENREDLVLRAMLSDRAHLVKYLLLLLSDDQTHSSEPPAPRPEPGSGGALSTSSSGPALLESFLRALDRDPKRLDYVHRLVEDLRTTEEGRRLLPPEFDAMWTPIWEMRGREQVCQGQ